MDQTWVVVGWAKESSQPAALFRGPPARLAAGSTPRHPVRCGGLRPLERNQRIHGHVLTLPVARTSSWLLANRRIIASSLHTSTPIGMDISHSDTCASHLTVASASAAELRRFLPHRQVLAGELCCALETYPYKYRSSLSTSRFRNGVTCLRKDLQIFPDRELLVKSMHLQRR